MRITHPVDARLNNKNILTLRYNGDIYSLGEGLEILDEETLYNILTSEGYDVVSVKYEPMKIWSNGSDIEERYIIKIRL